MSWFEVLQAFNSPASPSQVGLKAAQLSTDTGDSSSWEHAGQLSALVDLDCPYVRGLVLEGLSRRPAWQVTCIEGEGEEVPLEASTCPFHWGEYERMDWPRILSGQQVASSYCVRKGLIRKAHLAHNLSKWIAKHPNSRLARAVPETYILELDDPEYVDEALADVPEVRDMEDGSAVWIAKPSLTNQAKGICIFDRCSTLRTALETSEDLREWVVQRYVDRPLLIGGRKFHVRAYVLCVGSLTVYAGSDALALFAAQPYRPVGEGLPHLDAHLTNTCRLDGSVPEDEVVRLMSELPQVLAMGGGMSLEEAQRRVDRAMTDVNDVIAECFRAVSGELTFFSLPNCFELFGLDLLIDQDWNVWLLEANAEPDLQQTGQRLRSFIAGLVEGILQLVVDGLEAGESCSLGTKSAVHTFADREEARGSGQQARWLKVYEKDQGRSCKPTRDPG